jgi:hypothetical protein
MIEEVTRVTYRVGGMYARYGTRLAKVMVTRPWPPRLREALAAEFRAAGVEATVADTREPDAFSLAGEIRNFSTESRFGREAHIAVILRLRTPQGQPFEKRIDVRESSGYHRDPYNAYILERLLNKAFAEFVNKVASDPEIRAALLGPAPWRSSGQAAQQVTKTIPIIMAVSFDPVRVRIN